MKKIFLAGLASFLPIAVTIFIIIFVVDFLTTPFIGIIEQIILEYDTIKIAEKHHYILIFISRIVVLILFCIIIFLLGVLGRKIFFSWIFKLTKNIFYKIPIIKTIYKISQEISTNILIKKDKKLFKGTVVVPFPHEKTHALGLLSGPPPEQVAERKKNLEAVFVPTAPHPISGFLIMYNKNEIQKTNFETEDLFKFLLSCGIYKPGEKPPHES